MDDVQQSGTLNPGEPIEPGPAPIESGPAPAQSGPAPVEVNPPPGAPIGSGSVSFPPEASVSPIAGGDTFVVPASSEPTANPFIPQGVAPSGGVPPQPPSAGKPPRIPGKGGFPGKIVIVALVLLLLVGIGVGVKFALGAVTAAKEVTITYWGLWENDAIIRPVIADFEAAHPKTKVQYVKQSHKQYRERLQAAIDRGEGPDVFRFHNTWVAMLINQLQPVPATVMSASDFGSTFYPVASADLVAGDTIYGMPLMIDGLGLYYNEDLFSTAGVAVPTTWEDVLNMVPRLTVKQEDGTITTSAIALGTTGNVENYSDIMATMLMQNGANLTTPTGKEAEGALVFYRKFADSSDPVYTWNETLDNSIYAFATGKVAMILAPSWRAFDIQQMNPDLHFKIAPVPQLAGTNVTWASYWVEGVSKKSTHQAEAWEFVQYLTSQEAATKLYNAAAGSRLFGEPYARVDLASSISEDPFAGAYIKQAPTAKSFPLASRTFDNGLNDELIKYIEDAINGVAAGTAPTAVLETASEGFTKVLSKYGLTSAAPDASQ